MSSSYRLNKYISLCGFCSRRKADNFIEKGLVSVNGKIITDFSFLVNENDIVTIDSFHLVPKKHAYILLNKPKDCICTVSDEKQRKTIFHFIPFHDLGLFPVGRLDRNTTGIIIITNDGLLCNKLLHPSYKINKSYLVTIDKKLSLHDESLLLSGINVDNTVISFDEIIFASHNIRKTFIVNIHSGKYHIIKRMFISLGYKVTKLDRLSFAGISYGNLKRGEWRFLFNDEINYLKSL